MNSTTALECTLATESTDCELPRVCIEHRSKTDVIASSCQCTTAYGYQGEACDEMSVVTKLFLAWFIIMAILCVAVLGRTVVKLWPMVREISTYRHNQLFRVAVICALGMMMHLAYVLVTVADIAVNRVRPRSIDGVRVPTLWPAQSATLLGSFFFTILGVIYVTGAWIQLARRSKHLKTVNRSDGQRVRLWSLGVSVLLMVIATIMLLTGQRGQLSYFYGTVVVAVLVSWIAGSIFLTRVLHRSSSDDTFLTVVRRIKTCTRRAGSSLLILVVSSLLQGAANVEVGHETAATGGTFTPWQWGTLMIALNMLALFYFVETYALQGLGRNGTSGDGGGSVTNNPKTTTNKKGGGGGSGGGGGRLTKAVAAGSFRTNNTNNNADVTDDGNGGGEGGHGSFSYYNSTVPLPSITPTHYAPGSLSATRQDDVSAAAAEGEELDAVPVQQQDEVQSSSSPTRAHRPSISI